MFVFSPGNVFAVRGACPYAHYQFEHALIQETGFQSVLKPAGREYHQQIAQVLEQRFTEVATTQPELVPQ